MKILLVTNNKTFLVLFFSGLLCIFIAGLSLFISINPHLFQNYIQYEVGSLSSLNGLVQKKDEAGKKHDMSKGQKVYSKESFFIGPNSSAEFKLSGEKLNIIGPAAFDIHVVSPEKAQVFVNFSKFSSIKNATDFQNIKLTFNGWLIGPYFSEADLKTTQSQEINLPAISQKEADEKSKDLNKESMLDELIGAKRGLLKRCYENYLRKNPLATGKLVVEFTLNPSGKVSSSRIKDSSFFKDESFKNCIQDVFTRIKAKPFNGEAILVIYPIEFE